MNIYIYIYSLVLILEVYIQSPFYTANSISQDDYSTLIRPLSDANENTQPIFIFST